MDASDFDAAEAEFLRQRRLELETRLREELLALRELGAGSPSDPAQFTERDAELQAQVILDVVRHSGNEVLAAKWVVAWKVLTRAFRAGGPDVINEAMEEFERVEAEVNAWLDRGAA